MKLLALVGGKPSSGVTGDWSSDVDTDKGIIANYFDKKIENFDESFDKLGEKLGKKIGDKISELSTGFASDLIGALSIGALGFGLYQCIHMMFTQNKSKNGGSKPLDKIMLSYFIYFILRILNTAVKIRGGSIGE